MTLQEFLVRHHLPTEHDESMEAFCAGGEHVLFSDSVEIGRCRHCHATEVEILKAERDAAQASLVTVTRERDAALTEVTRLEADLEEMQWAGYGEDL